MKNSHKNNNFFYRKYNFQKFEYRAIAFSSISSKNAAIRTTKDLSFNSKKIQNKYKKAEIISKKSLAQNFLIDDSYLSKIADSAEIVNDDLVLEVGPGLGNLTRHLLKAGANVLAVEKDKNLCQKLENLVDCFPIWKPAIKIITADVLNVNLKDVIKNFVEYGLEHPSTSYPMIYCEKHNTSEEEEEKGNSVSIKKYRRVKLLANLPYNLTSDFLKKVLVLGREISEMYLMIQDDVGKKLAIVDPGDDLYRNISVRTRFFSTPKYLFTIPNTAYYPRPNVTSCLIRFRIRQPEEYPNIRGSHQEFCDFLNTCYYTKRKMLKNACACLFGEDTVATALKELGLSSKERAEKLQVNDFVILFNLLRVKDIN